MRERVGTCSVCQREVYCQGGFLAGTLTDGGELLCFSCDRVRIKRIYQSPEPDDGRRVLVDRLWPRGVKKAEAGLAAWLKEAAPSPALRQWFAHRPERFAEFRTLYREEIGRTPERKEAVEQLLRWARQGRLTLLYAAQDPEHNHAVVLQELLREKLAELWDEV